MHIIIMETIVFYSNVALEFMWNSDVYEVFGILFVKLTSLQIPLILSRTP